MLFLWWCLAQLPPHRTITTRHPQEELGLPGLKAPRSSCHRDNVAASALIAMASGLRTALRFVEGRLKVALWTIPKAVLVKTYRELAEIANAAPDNSPMLRQVISMWIHLPSSLTSCNSLDEIGGSVTGLAPNQEFIIGSSWSGQGTRSSDTTQTISVNKNGAFIFPLKIRAR